MNVSKDLAVSIIRDREAAGSSTGSIDTCPPDYTMSHPTRYLPL
jgi:hypothetical protein